MSEISDEAFISVHPSFLSQTGNQPNMCLMGGWTAYLRLPPRTALQRSQMMGASDADGCLYSCCWFRGEWGIVMLLICDILCRLHSIDSLSLLAAEEGCWRQPARVLLQMPCIHIMQLFRCNLSPSYLSSAAPHSQHQHPLRCLLVPANVPSFQVSR